MKVTHDQFAIEGTQVRHVLTNAIFRMEGDTVMCDLDIGGTKLGTGHDFDVEELKEVAREVITLQKTTCL